MKYLLAMVASDRDRFRDALASFLSRVDPAPTALVAIDLGRRAAVEQQIRDGDLDLGTISIVRIVASRRRGNENTATARAWEAIAEAFDQLQLRFGFYLEDRYEFVRRVDLLDAAHVLEREPTLAQMAFPAAGDLALSQPGVVRGSGAVRWRLRPDGFTTGPFLTRPQWAKAFPWPGNADELAIGIRSSQPETGFGTWGLGDPWVTRVAA